MTKSRNLLGTIIVLIVVVSLLPSFVGLQLVDGSAAVNGSSGNYTIINSEIDNIPADVTVKATRGNALDFDGNETIASAAPENLTQGSWTVCAAAELSHDANSNATYDIFAYDNASLLLQYDAGQWSAYYDNGSADAKATINAVSPKSGFTPVCARYNASADDLVIVRNGTVSGADSLTTTTDSRNLSSDWRGRIDEVRTFADPLEQEDLNTYAQDPIKPLPGTNRTARFMFDEGSGSTTAVYFANESEEVQGADWTSGVSGQPMRNEEDYELSGDPLSIRYNASGYLNGAPVVYISWEWKSGGMVFGMLPLFAGLVILGFVAKKIIEI